LGGSLTCKELSDFLSDYLTNELDAGTRDSFDRHLSVCPACVDYLHSYRLTIQMTAAAGQVANQNLDAVPEELIAAILDARRNGN